MGASSNILNHLATGALLLLIAVSAGADPALHLDPPPERWCSRTAVSTDIAGLWPAAVFAERAP